MKIYKDKKLTEEIEDKTFDLGIVPAGEVKRFSFWIYNNDKSYLQLLKFSVDHQEVAVIKAPVDLKPEDVGELILEWSPSVTLKQGLKTVLRVSGVELWG